MSICYARFVTDNVNLIVKNVQIASRVSTIEGNFLQNDNHDGGVSVDRRY